MRVLAACSLGGAGHLLPLVPFLEAARRRGDITAVLAPRSLASRLGAMGVDRRGHTPRQGAAEDGDAP